MYNNIYNKGERIIRRENRGVKFIVFLRNGVEVGLKYLINVSKLLNFSSCICMSTELVIRRLLV